MSVFIVATSVTTSSAPFAARIIAFSNGMGTHDYNNGSYFGFLRQHNTGFGPYRNGAYIRTDPPSYNTNYLWECWFDGTNEYASVGGGGVVAQQSIGSSGNFAITTYAVGSNTNTGDGPGYMSGSISDILVFNTALSTDDRQKVEGYLAWKWGLVTSLPSAHPYYSSPPSRPAGFIPTSISNLLLWFDANDSSTISYSGSNISQWNDKSGNSRNATPYSNVCTYNATGFNGKPSIYLNDSSLQAPLPSTNCFPNGITVIQAYYYTGGSYGTPFTISYSNLGDPFDIYTTTRYINNYSAGSTSINSTIDTRNLNTPCLFGITGNTTSWNEWVNGGTQTYTNNLSTDFKNVNSTKFFIGGRWNQGTNLTGHVAETVVYSTVLSTSNRQKVEGYLAWKWGLQASLPSAHPYKNISP